MGLHLCLVLICLGLLCPGRVQTSHLGLVDSEFSHEDNWVYRNSKKTIEVEEPCNRIRPTTRDLIKRVYSILTFFDKANSNTAFLRKYRATVHGMAEGANLDQEAAYYAAVLTPLIFLQNYKNTWCLLERFHRALNFYQNSHPMEKRSALKLLQNFRGVTQKIKNIIWNLPGTTQKLRTISADVEDEDVVDKNDIRYITELIKNLG